MSAKWGALPFAALVSLSACTSMLAGPSVVVLPGVGKPFEEFQRDDSVCRQWAAHQAEGEAGDAAAHAAASGAAGGTLAGTGPGAAIGAADGGPGTSAAIGAGAGRPSGGAVQRRYDIAYQQCMYARGNQIPGIVPASRPRGMPSPPPPPPPSSATPTPSPGTPPR